MAYSSNPFSPILEALRYAAEYNERKKQEEEERKKWAQQLALQQQKAKSEENYWKQLLALRKKELEKRYPVEKTEEEITDIIGDPRNTYIAATNLLKQQGINSIDELFNTYDKDKALQIIKTTLWRAFSSNDPVYNKKLTNWLDTWGGIVSSYGIQGGKKKKKDEKTGYWAKQTRLEQKPSEILAESFNQAVTGIKEKAKEIGSKVGGIFSPSSTASAKENRKAIKFRNKVKEEKKKKPLEGEVTNWRDSSGATGSW